MADEHEEKYGPGLFTKLEETLDRLEAGTRVKAAEKGELLEKLKYYQTELAECTDIHPQDLDKLVEDIDMHMLQLVTGKKVGSLEERLETTMEMQYEEEALEEDEESEAEETGVEMEKEDEAEKNEVKMEEEYEEEEIEEEFDLEEELGLGSVETEKS
jgi:hypothetical protein